MSWPARFLHLVALGGLAIAQPLLGLLGGEPQFWIARDASYVDVAVVIFLATLLVPLLSFGIERLIALANRAAAWWFHLAVVFGLGFVFAVYAIETVIRQNLGARVILIAALVAAGLLTYVYRRFEGVRGFVAILAIVPIALSVLLIFNLPPLGGSTAETIPVGIDSEAPVVFAVYDEMQIAAILGSDGLIDRTRYPNFGRLADLSTWYPNGTTVNDNTLTAVPAILTGQMPDRQLEGVVDDYPQNLFTVLGSTHAMRVDENVTQLCPTNLCDESSQAEAGPGDLSVLLADTGVVYLHAVFPESQRYRLPQIGNRWMGFLEAEAAEEAYTGPIVGPQATALGERTDSAARAVQFGNFVDSFDPTLGPALYYLHVDLPHPPWSYLPTGQRYASSDFIAGQSLDGWWYEDPWYPQQGYQRYVLHLGFLDELTGLMLDQLEELGMLEDAMIVVTSDHGANFEATESRRGFTEDTLAAVGGVPFFVKYPGQMVGDVDDRSAQTVDILPTVVEALGGSIGDVDGSSLTDQPTSDDKIMVANDGDVFAVSLAEYRRLASDQIVFNEGQLRSGAGFVPAYEEAGPLPALNGRSIDEFAIRDSRGSFTIDTAHFYTNLDPNGPWMTTVVPAVVEAGDDSLPDLFAVAVNGTIRATITAYESTPRTARIYAVVPPYSFNAGANDIEVYGIEDGDERATLVRFS